MLSVSKLAGIQMQQIRHFVALVEVGSFHRAAVELGISQPGLTRSIQRLEEQLGLTLVDRTSRGALPNAFGRAFYEYAVRVSNETRGLVRELDEIGGGTSGEIRLGLAANFNDPSLGVLLADHVFKRLGLSLTISQGFFSDIMLTGLRRREIDIGIGLWPVDWPATDLAIEPLREFTSVVVCGPRSRYYSKGIISIEELASTPWVGSGLHEVDRFLERKFAAHGLRPPSLIMRTTSSEILKKLLQEGEAVALLTRSCAVDFQQMGAVAILKCALDPIIAQAVMVFMSHTALSPRHVSIMNAVRRHYR